VEDHFPLISTPFHPSPGNTQKQFLVMYPIAQHVDVVSFAPTVMISLSIAMGIDYSLFQLTRYAPPSLPPSLPLSPPPSLPPPLYPSLPIVSASSSPSR